MFFLFQISPSDSKILLQVSCWSVEDAIKKRNSKVLGGPSSQLAAGATALMPSSSSQQMPPIAQSSSSSTKFTTYCEVCAVSQPTVDFSFLVRVVLLYWFILFWTYVSVFRKFQYLVSILRTVFFEAT